MSSKRYTLKQKALAMAVYKMTNGKRNKTAQITGVSPASITAWKDNPVIVSSVETVKQEINTGIEKLLLELIGSSSEKVDKANLKDTTTAIGILIDKWLLLNNSPTEIQEQRKQQVSWQMLVEKKLNDLDI